jgi:hypothetical protein
MVSKHKSVGSVILATLVISITIFLSLILVRRKWNVMVTDMNTVIVVMVNSEDKETRNRIKIAEYFDFTY